MHALAVALMHIPEPRAAFAKPAVQLLLAPQIPIGRRSHSRQILAMLGPMESPLRRLHSPPSLSSRFSASETPPRSACFPAV